jgi:ADP-ribose pyrophosphatase YjhB (NUDIX family)
MIEVFDRIFLSEKMTGSREKGKPRFHFVIVDYLCERIAGEPRAGSDVTDVALVGEAELPGFHLTETATRVLKKAFAMARTRSAAT